jgi:hypothetical protein
MNYLLTKKSELRQPSQHFIFTECYQISTITLHLNMYKGKGARDSPSSYRPISLCSCISKLLERVVIVQLTNHINSVRPLSTWQFGSRAGRSTVTNLLACDATIVKYIDRKVSFDIIWFDFKRAFDKVPHDLLLYSLENLNMLPSTLNWFASFLHGRTQRVIISHSSSATCDVTSGVPQGSVLSPTLFCIYIDTLLQSITELMGNDNIKIFAYADDFKLVTETSTDQCRMAQQVVDLVNNWSITHKMPLSIEKSGVLRHNLPNNVTASTAFKPFLTNARLFVKTCMQ